MRYQAKASTDLKTFEEIRKNKTACAQAFAKFEQDNPEGCFRKQLIDWSEYKRRFIKRLSATERVKDKLMNLRKFKKFIRSEEDSDAKSGAIEKSSSRASAAEARPRVRARRPSYG